MNKKPKKVGVGVGVDGKSLAAATGDESWYRNVLIPIVAQRGTAIIEARGPSSAASAANAAPSISFMTGAMEHTDAGSRWLSLQPAA